SDLAGEVTVSSNRIKRVPRKPIAQHANKRAAVGTNPDSDYHLANIVFVTGVIDSKIDVLARGEILEFVSLAIKACEVFNANFACSLSIGAMGQLGFCDVVDLRQVSLHAF